MDAGQAALLVRATARVSAVILAGNLLVAARRVGGAAERDALPATELRRLDVATFVAFIVSHTIHFVCVGLLTIATAGANIDARTGYAPVIAVGVLFYLACVAALRVKLRCSRVWAQPRNRRIEVWSLVAIWLVLSGVHHPSAAVVAVRCARNRIAVFDAGVPRSREATENHGGNGFTQRNRATEGNGGVRPAAGVAGRLRCQPVVADTNLRSLRFVSVTIGWHRCPRCGLVARAPLFVSVSPFLRV
jgi:hypothetical protein